MLFKNPIQMIESMIRFVDEHPDARMQINYDTVSSHVGYVAEYKIKGQQFYKFWSVANFNIRKTQCDTLNTIFGTVNNVRLSNAQTALSLFDIYDLADVARAILIHVDQCPECLVATVIES